MGDCGDFERIGEISNLFICSFGGSCEMDWGERVNVNVLGKGKTEEEQKGNSQHPLITKNW